MPGGELAPTLDLVRKAQGGDRSAREELCARYLPRVRRIVAARLGKRLRDLVEVDDVVQEALLLGLANLDQYEVRPDRSFYHWISTIVANAIRNQARWFGARKRGGDRPLAHPSPPLSVSLLAAPDSSPSQIASGREFEQRLEEAFLALPETERSILEMRALSGMSYAEIAETMGVVESSARATYARALARLMGMLEG